MSWTIPRAQFARPAKWLLAALVVYGFLRQTGFYNFTAREAEGLNVLIQLVGGIYAVLLAFAIFVIWGQFTEVETWVIRESNALHDMLRFSDYLSGDARSNIRRAMANYTRHVLTYEWDALAEGRKNKPTEDAFSHFVKTVVEALPQNENEQVIHGRLLDMAQKTSECRDERVAKSMVRMPPTLASLVDTIAGALLLLIFIYPFHHWMTGIFCLALIAAVLFLANFVMTDTDNPLKGAWNVSPQPFSDLRI
jgi:hypothetical protein